MTTIFRISDIPTMAKPLADGALKATPQYKRIQAEFQDVKEQVDLGTRCMAIAAVALAVLGFAFIATGIGVAFLVVALPLGFFAYNSYKTSSNIDEIIKNPSQYIEVQTNGNKPSDFDPRNIIKLGPDLENIKTKLKENTFLFDWAIDLGVEHAYPAA